MFAGTTRLTLVDALQEISRGRNEMWIGLRNAKRAIRWLPKRLLLSCGLLLGGLVTSLAPAAEPKQPNVLLIVSDDQGYNDLGMLGNGIITPALDRLVREGTRLTNFYVAWPACTPSRASLLTGRYPQRNGMYDMVRNEAPDYGHRYTPSEYAVTFERIGGLDTREVLLPQLLRAAGYRTAIFGKWDLGALQRFLPTSRGFDQFYGFVNTGIDYYTHERYGVPSMYRDSQPTEADKGTYCTDLFQREALQFLSSRTDVPKNTANHRPFFLYLPFNAPHNSSALEPEIRSTIQAPDEYKSLYPEIEKATQAKTNNRYGNPATVATRAARQRDYRAAVTCMDAAIGSVIERLEQTSELDNTIVVFMSDNGGGGGADNSPLSGKKADTWEGGIRVPCIVRWPSGKIPAGQTSDAFLTSLELLPSLLAVTNAELPSEIVLDGYDWWDTLRGQAPSPRTEMFWKRRDRTAARVDQWKWVAMDKGAGGLFDLSRDPGETHDLSQQHPDQAARVVARFEAWLSEMQAAQPRGPFRDY